MWNLIFLVTGAIFIALLLIIFFSKEVINSKENRFFKALIIINVIEYCIEIPLQLFVRGLGIESFTVDIFSKLYLLVIFTWFSFFSIYTFVICLDKKDEKKYEKQFSIVKIINFCIWIIGGVLLIYLPFDKFHDADKMYIYGSAVETLKLLLGLYMIVWISLLLLNLKNIKTKRYAPIFLVLLLMGLNAVLQTIDPSILIASMIGTFICYIMAFTIENPDLKMLRQMELAKDQAERANRAKSDFLSSMSHEIRTPLNAIVGLSEDNISYEDKCPPEVVENSKDIMTASQTLLEIVGNILDINKIEANKLEIVESPYNFVKEVSDMCKITQTRIGEKNVIFHLNMADDIPYELIGDKSKVKEIINNLLTNAIKYTEQGDINLNIRCINDLDKNVSKIIISCQDTGRGIKAEYINKLFTKFERLDIEKNTTTEGTGLGLAITKALVEMMGGNINVQSQFGKGSIFMVQIPQKISKVARPMTEQELMNTASKLYTNNYIKPVPVVSEVPLQNNKHEAEQVQNNSRYGFKKVLIVDDNTLNIKVAKRALSDFNFEIEECYDGLQCLEKVKVGNEYDLILMDIMMPNMSGVTAMKKLKENPNFKIPTIALTADAVAGAEEKYKSEGFIDYIAKPFKKEQIQERLDNIFLISTSQNDKIGSDIELNNNEDIEELIYDIEPTENKVSYLNKSEDNADLSNSQLVNALSDMSKPVSEIAVQDVISKDIHVIGENKNEGNE